MGIDLAALLASNLADPENRGERMTWREALAWCLKVPDRVVYDRDGDPHWVEMGDQYGNPTGQALGPLRPRLCAGSPQWPAFAPGGEPYRKKKDGKP